MASDTARQSGRERTLRSILVDPFRQIKFGIYMIGTSLVFILVSAFMFWHAFDDQYNQLITIFKVVDPEELWELRLNDVFKANAIRIIIFFLVFLGGMFTLAFYLTHRYYGPLISIERFLDDLTDGNYKSRVSIRSTDELQELVRKLNHLASVLEQRHPRNRT